ncbi:hypothetical protein A1M00_13005 [Lactiplantibacillus plantarum]|uniref:hypothetical protein n=1 Tax=Lactiplantibacillus plantarum TaxID=1590 RepID=UPI0007D97BAB|nr:hypothetical protein [Lactiplantibacillus plantarum]OAM71697.1 hypothetical protein A1M00_13005 [Lactiplantibacillus plantarum]
MRTITEPIKVLLSDEQAQALRDFVYQLTTDSISQAKRDVGASQQWLRKKKAAAYADVSEGTFTGWTKQGLAGHVINGSVLFNKRDIDFYINHNGKMK